MKGSFHLGVAVPVADGKGMVEPHDDHVLCLTPWYMSKTDMSHFQEDMLRDSTWDAYSSSAEATKSK